MLALALTAVASASAPLGEIPLVDWSSSDPKLAHKWMAKNDPVMGGRSYSTVSVSDGMLNFTGSCEIVPSLQAPGFITAINSDQNPWADVSSCTGLKITGMSANSYSGFRISFGRAHPAGGKFFAYGYKASFAPSQGTVGSVSVPFKSFTDFWDDATGKAIHTCESNPNYCPDAKTLQDMKTMSIWGEGVQGAVQLELASIAGYGCSGAR
jgi:hypothetical protein